MVKVIDTPSVLFKTAGDIFDTIGYLLFHPTERWKGGGNVDRLKWVTSLEKLLPMKRIEAQLHRDFERSYNFQVRGGFK
jgi:hypothetical protein